MPKTKELVSDTLEEDVKMSQSGSTSMEKDLDSNRVETKLVQMRLPQRALNNVEKLVDFFCTNNRTRIVMGALELAVLIAQAINEGGNVYIKRKNGEQETIKLVRY